MGDRPGSVPSAAYAAVILAIVTFGQNVGMTLGPLVVGYIVEFLGDWAACSAPLAIMAVIGGVIAFFINVGTDKDSTVEAEAVEA